ncbi:MAG TPA: GNAT family N-acetyltransferase [Sphingomicrobium sp.]|nr:GNAT family N-acetyltransferase [Sphingomicrobium sp.]
MIDAIRLADGTAEDLDKVMRVMTAAFDPMFGEAWTRSQCAGILPMTGVSLMLARDAEGAALGFALFRTIAAEAELLLLAVDPQHRRRGVGRRLLDGFIERARDAGARRVHLEVRDGNPAVEMYRSAGFAAAGRRRGYYRGETEQFDAITLARTV